jgi:Glycosyl transferase family 2
VIDLKAVASRVLASARTQGGTTDLDRPVLSIVVPVYNVEPYVEECLRSIARQPLRHCEVVLVDDGSTDRSCDIAAAFAARHQHVRLIARAHAGLGAARNAGADASRGKYLAFVDSDDVLPPDAYRRMLKTLERTGSDFAIGQLQRDDGRRRFAAPRMRRNHQTERLQVTLEEMPEILADVFAVNKVFRRSFWVSAGLAFPVGVRYEDQPTLTAAYLQARSFDVLTDTVYFWRVRDDGSSITQQRHRIADLRDRIATKRAANLLLQGAPPHVREVWLTDVLPVDMVEYYRSVPQCSDEYWTMLRDAVREFWTDDVPFEQTRMPVRQRLMGWLVANDRRADLEELLSFMDRHSHGLPLRVRGGKVTCRLAGHEGAGVLVPSELPELVPANALVGR